MRSYTGAITGRRRNGQLEIEAADDEVSMSLGLALDLAAHGNLTLRDGQLVLSGFYPDGQSAELVYTITGLAAAANSAAEEGGWINLRRAG